MKSKPVQKRQFVYQNESILLIFKTIEIIVQNNENRRLNPIYVPLHLTKDIYKIPPTQEHELVKLLFENAKFSDKSKQFEFNEKELEKSIKRVVRQLK